MSMEKWRSFPPAEAAWARQPPSAWRRMVSRWRFSSSGKGEALANELGGIGVTGSNQSNDDLQRLVDAVMRQWGRIDVLVNNGGHGPRGPVLEITDEQWHLGLDIYLMNVIRPVRIVAPIMQAQKSGSIINFHRSRPSSRLRDSRRPRCSGQDLPPTQRSSRIPMPPTTCA